MWPKSDFPFFSYNSISYLDNAATTHKPTGVLEAEQQFYTTVNANIHRSAHESSEQATFAYENARAYCAHLLQVDPSEIIFTSGATAGINMVAFGWALKRLAPGDEIILSEAEHHANIVPWQQVAAHTGAILRFLRVDKQGLIEIDQLAKLITPKTRLISLTHISNVTGQKIDMAIVKAHAQRWGIPFLIDASQSAPHYQLNVQELGCDFLVFSGHKMLGPTGVGVLFVRKDRQQEMNPLLFGGGAVREVSLDKTVIASGPHAFEAGTPPIAQVIGLRAALEYRAAYDSAALISYQAHLINYFIQGLRDIPSFRMIGDVNQLSAEGHLVSFVHDTIHAHDVAAFLDKEGIAVRAGHHCAQPLHKALHIPASVRVSVYGYTTLDDIQRCLESLKKLA